MSANFTDDDIQRFESRGISQADVARQLGQFEAGFPYAKLARACTPGDGIVQISEADQERLLEEFEAVTATGRVGKFVPASGAASRMFKSLLSVLNDEGGDSDLAMAEQFQTRLSEFAFGDQLPADANLKTLLAATLTDEGLNLANIPKGLIPFHRYGDHNRSAFAEHLAEGLATCADDRGTVRLHFTVSPEFEAAIAEHLGEVKARLAPDCEVRMTFSVQHPATDTIAVAPDNSPFRDDDGQLVFRPGGHGALLRNLNEVEGDIVFVKNIDNIVPEHLAGTTNHWKQILGAYLAELEEEIYAHLHHLTAEALEDSAVENAFAFCRDSLHLDLSQVPDEGDGRVNAIVKLLDRPIRVCGMVRNEGEPGGGPFWVEKDGRLSRQIVESAQVDPNDTAQQELLKTSTHFNPVDLVCGVRNMRGKCFDLARYVDTDAGFISSKSQNGRELKALELPGLWNGAMADWITLFVEVPLATFNPVKTVMDLLRPTHQPAG
jgi:hypothetical protein